MKNKIFTRIIITTLLCAFLTFNVGKVTRVSAVGTTIAASAAAALCAVGIVYCSYMALTGASVHVPEAADNITEWLQDVGTKVVQYPSGRAAYEELYPNMLSLNPATTLIHDFLDSEVWTWTADKIRSWTNDFSSVDVNQAILSYYDQVDASQTPSTNFDYSTVYTPAEFGTIVYQYQGQTMDYMLSIGMEFQSYVNSIVYVSDGYGMVVPITNSNEMRNILRTNGDYGVQQYVNGAWQDVNSFSYGFPITIPWTSYNYLNVNSYEGDGKFYGGISQYTNTLNGAPSAYPLMANEEIYVEATGEIINTIEVSTDVYVQNPQWPTLPPEDDNKPVIPYAKLPYDPNWIDPGTGIPGGGNWGLPLGDLLDLLESLAGALMEIGAIGELINQFKDSLTGDTYYIYYDDSNTNTNFYEYYTITNFGDNNYTYNIDVSEVDKELPVDLNTIQTYSNNRYLEQIKQSAVNGSSIVRDLAVFWYDVDPEVTYIALGICIVILIGAFTGKLGHS